jgi:hypothetical protein
MRAAKDDAEPQACGEPPTSNRRGNLYKRGTRDYIHWELDHWRKGIERTRDWLRQNTRDENEF